jgi:hypothetical protein
LYKFAAPRSPDWRGAATMLLGIVNNLLVRHGPDKSPQTLIFVPRHAYSFGFEWLSFSK